MNEQFDNYSFLIKQAPASIYKDRLVFIVNGSTFGQGFTYPFKPSGFYYSDGSKWIYKGATNNTGGTGTVTSVDITTNAPAITITGNPITTAGTIDLNFNGANTDYIDGTGALQPFPTSLGTVTSVDLTMPSAFAVSGNPITTAGTLAVTGAGTTSQYIRGDGTLANFPTSTGGGASISYYLNGSVNQGTFSGNTYYEMNRVPVIGAGTNFSIAANGYIAQFITDANDPSQLNIPAGNWNFEMYFSASSGGGTPTFYVELYKYDGAAFTLIASSSTNPEGITNGTAVDLYTTALAVPATTLAITDRLAVRVYVNNSGRTITLHTEDNNLCQVITTFTTGLTALNGLTAQVQTFATGTTGTDFGIVSSGSTHTFNLPTASALNRGALSSADWTTFNNKQNAITPAALTKVDDTNVTLTLGGTPATALLQATSLTLGWSGQLSIARGGTGLAALGTANQLLRVNAGATALEYFTPTFLTGLTVGTTPVASGTVGRVLFEGAGNVLQENAILNLDTTNGLIIGGATTRATRLTVVNSANTNATKIFTQRNAADSADYTTLRGDGVVDFNNVPNNTSVNGILSAVGSTLLAMFSQPNNFNPILGIGNAFSYSGGAVNNINTLGSNNTVVTSTGSTFISILGNRNTATNGDSNVIVGRGIHMSGNSRSNAIGGRSTGATPNVISGNDVTIIGWNTDTTALAYTASLVTYFNNNNASHWLHENGNIGLFGKKYTIHTNTGSNPLNTRMNLTATNTLTIHNGTETNGNITAAIQVYARDITVGNSGLHVWDEAGRIFYAGQYVGMRTNHDLQLAANNTVFARLRTTGAFCVANLAADPVGNNGDIYYNTTTNKFRVFENGAWVNMI